MVKSPSMALSFDDRRRIAAAYDIFARVDARRKAARRSRRKSKPREEIKPRSLARLRGLIFIIGVASCSVYMLLSPFEKMLNFNTQYKSMRESFYERNVKNFASR